MKTFLIALLAATASLGFVTPADAQVNERQWRQQQRIQQGVRSGELTRREAYRLQRQQARIRHYEARSRWDGGGLSRRERARLDHMQDRASRNIRRQKYDRQDYGRYRRW